MRRVPCSDEVASGADARRSDWLLENAVARYFIRDTANALTRLSVAGGTVIDAVSVGADDVLLEAVPLIEGQWFTAATATPISEPDAVRLEISGTLPDGSEATVTYRLDADAQALTIEGADGISITPKAGTEVRGPTIDDGDDLLGVQGARAVTDLGGWITVEGTQGLISGTRDEVYEDLYAGQRRLIREARGDWLEVYDDDLAPLARAPIGSSGQIALAIPDSAAWLQATADGAAPSERVSVDQSGLIEVGPSGRLQVRATDGDRNPVPATLLWEGTTSVALPGQADTLTLPAGEGDAVWFAGPGRELLTEPLEIVEDEKGFSNIVLPWAVTPGALVDLARLASPDPTERRGSEALLTEAAGAGRHYVVMVATDEVAGGLTGVLEPLLVAQNGSTSAGTGAPSAWPWSGTDDKPAHGATDWADLSAEDLLAVMSRRDSRTLMVTPSWIDAAGPAPGWLPAPDLLQISGLDDLEAAAAAFDAWIPLSLVGPLTWVDSVDPREPFAEVDIEAGLMAGQTTATNGPRLSLRVNDVPIGGVADIQGEARIDVRVEAPTWIPLSGAALYGPGPTPLATWALDETGEALRLEASLELDVPPSWLVLAAWGDDASPPWLDEPAWALTSPVWLRRP